MDYNVNDSRAFDDVYRLRPQSNSADTKTRQIVWVVEIPLADSILAVGTTEGHALRGAAIRALEYLNNAGVGVDRSTGEHWTADTLVQYFGYRSTECELDGIGERH